MSDESQPRLVAVGGLPGAGKSTVASQIAERLQAERLRTDELRKELFDSPRYTDTETTAVYRQLCDRAIDRLRGNESVVLDATFAQRQHRRAVHEASRDHEAMFRFILVVCDQSVLESRIVERDGISDADLSVSRQFRSLYDPVEIAHETVDNSGGRAETRSQVAALF